MQTASFIAANSALALLQGVGVYVVVFGGDGSCEEGGEEEGMEESGEVCEVHFWSLQRSI